MALEVNIDPQQINDYLSRAVLESAIGQAIKDQVVAYIKKMESTYDNPVKGAVEREVFQLVTTVVHEQFRPQIEAAVREYMTEAVITEVAKKALDKLYRNS